MTSSPGAWVLVGPGGAIDALRDLVALRRRERPVVLHRRDSPPEAEVWPTLVPSGAAGVLLVGDRRHAPRTVVDGPFVVGKDGAAVPLGWVPLPSSRGPGLRALVATTCRVAPRSESAPVAVLGQRSPRYRRLGERTVHHLGGVPALRWGAERVTREDLVAGLAAGLGVAVYLGHGRPSGWAAYRGLRAEHLAPLAAEPLGCLLSVTCWTASRRGVGSSFCEQVVLSGAAATSVGAVRPVEHLASTRVVLALAAALRVGAADAATLLRATLLDDAGDPVPEAADLRLCGDPLASLGAAQGAAEQASAVFAPPPDLQPAAVAS